MQTAPLSSSHLSKTGIIDSKYLNSQETILYEARPRWIAVVGLKLLIWDLFMSLFFFAGAAAAPPAATGFIFFIWFLIAPLPTLLRTMRWHATFYGLTDQRILKGSGITGSSLKSITVKRTTGLMDVNTARVTSVEMNQNTAGKIFGYGTILLRTNAGGMEWNGVKHVFDVRRYVEETLSHSQEAAGTELSYRDAITRTVAKIATEQKLGFLPQQAPYSVPGNAPATPSIPPAPQNAAMLQAQPTLQCTKCGMAYPSGTKFCSNCGSPLQPLRGVPLEA